MSSGVNDQVCPITTASYFPAPFREHRDCRMVESPQSLSQLLIGGARDHLHAARHRDAHRENLYASAQRKAARTAPEAIKKVRS
jgi:hypothetical protein